MGEIENSVRPTEYHNALLRPLGFIIFCFDFWQHFREGQAHSESFVKKAEQFQFSITTRAETTGTVNLQVRGAFQPRNRQPKPALSMHEISRCDQIQANHKKGMIMKSSTDLAPDLVE